MDADGLTFACATVAEERVGRRAGLQTARIGVGAANGIPDGPRLVSFGLAGALDGLPNGAVLDAARVVDEDGNVLWEGEGLGVPDATRATILAADRLVDDPAERRRLRERTGADAVDLESGALARSGRLQGCLRVISDTPGRTLNGIWQGVKPQGRYDWVGLAGAFLRSPLGFARAAADGKRALRRLREVAVRMAS